MVILNICTFNIVVSPNRQSKHGPLADSTYIAVDPGFFHILQQLPQRCLLANCSKLTKSPRIWPGGRYGRASSFLMRRSTSCHSSYAVFSPRSATLPHHRLSPVKELPCTRASENTSFTAIHVAEKYIRTNKRETYSMQSSFWLIPIWKAAVQMVDGLS